MKHVCSAILILCSFSLKAMNEPWSVINTNRLSLNILEAISFANQRYNEKNGVLKVFTSMGWALAAAAPNTLPYSKLAQHMIDDCSKNERYSKAFDQAVATERMKEKKLQEKDAQWDQFRKSAAFVLSDYLEQHSALKINHSPEKLHELFEKNSSISVDSKEGQWLAAGALALFGLIEIRDRKRKELADAKAQ